MSALTKDHLLLDYQEFQKVVEHSTVAMIFGLQDGTVLLVNKDLRIIACTKAAVNAFRKCLGYEVGVGTSVLDLVPESRKQALSLLYQNVFNGQQQTSTIEISCDEAVLHFEMRYKPVYDKRGEVIAVLVTSYNITERVKAEVAIKQTEQRWRFALEGTNQGVLDWNIRTGKTYYSTTWKKLFGFEEHEIGDNIDDWKKLLHPEDLQNIEKTIQEHTCSSEPYYETTQRIRTKKGDYKWILFRGMIIENDASGKALRMIGTHTDITEQKTIEEGYKQLFYNHPMPMWIYDTETLDIVDVNDAAVAKYGYSKEEFLSLTIKNLRPEEDYAVLKNLLESVKDGGQATHHSVRHIKKNGEIIDTEVTSKDLIYHGRVCRMICSNDITKRIAAENELKKSNERFELACKAASVAILDWDLATNNIHWSKGLQKFFGYRENINLETWTSFIHEKDRPRVEHSLEHTLQYTAKKYWKEEYQFKDAKGKYRYVLDRGLIVRDSDGKPIRMIGVIRDITDRKIKERELERSYERFEKVTLATTDVVWDWNLKTNCLVVTDNYSKTFGFPLSDSNSISSDEFIDRVHPDDVGQLRSNINKALANPNVEKLEEEFRYRRQDGSYAYVVDKGFIIRNKEGRPVRLIGAASDVSDKKYQQEIVALELRVFETSAIPSISFNTVIKTFLQGFEYLHSDINAVLLLKQNDDYNLITTKSFNGHTKELQQWIQKNTQRTISHLNKNNLIVANVAEEDWSIDAKSLRDQQWKLSWLVPVQHADGSELGCFAIFLKHTQTPSETQINTLIRLRNLLRILIVNNQSLHQVQVFNERYNMMLQATHDMIWDWNLETGTFYRNEEGLRKVYGVDDNQSIQNINSWLARIHPEDYEYVEGIINKIIQSIDLEKFELEYRFKKDDGTYTHVYDRGIIIKNAGGKPVRMIGAAQNISERKKLEEELVKKELERQKDINQATIDSQEQERREIGKELHDNVNQVLTTTKLYLDLLLSNAEMKDELIKKSSDNVIYVINEIRQLSRSLMDPTLGDLGLTDSLKDLIENINITQKLSIALQADKKSDVQLSANQKLAILRITQEALNNIVKYANAAKATVTLKTTDNNVDLMIKDNGIGFDMKNVKRGVGLKNIQNRVYLMNGKLTIETNPGKGCCIHVQFPVHLTN